MQKLRDNGVGYSPCDQINRPMLNNISPPAGSSLEKFSAKSGITAEATLPGALSGEIGLISSLTIQNASSQKVLISPQENLRSFVNFMPRNSAEVSLNSELLMTSSAHKAHERLKFIKKGAKKF